MCLWMRSPLDGVLGHPLWQFPQRKWPHESASFSPSFDPGDNHFLSFFFKIKSHKHLHALFFDFTGFPGAAKHHLQPAPAAGEQGARHWEKWEPVQKKWWVSRLTSSSCPAGYEYANHHVIKAFIKRNWKTEGQRWYDDSSCFLPVVCGKCGRRGSARWRTATWPSHTGR